MEINWKELLSTPWFYIIAFFVVGIFGVMVWALAIEVKNKRKNRNQSGNRTW